MTASQECGEPPRKIQKELQMTDANNNRANSSTRNKVRSYSSGKFLFGFGGIVNISKLNIKFQFESKMIHLIGYVENALTWYEMLRNIDVHVIYNVIGNFLSSFYLKF